VAVQPLDPTPGGCGCTTNRLHWAAPACPGGQAQCGSSIHRQQRLAPGARWLRALDALAGLDTLYVAVDTALKGHRRVWRWDQGVLAMDLPRRGSLVEPLGDIQVLQLQWPVQDGAFHGRDRHLPLEQLR
jgi:hypothetical protein